MGTLNQALIESQELYSEYNSKGVTLPAINIELLLKETMENLPEKVRMTRLVRRLNSARQNGHINDYKIHKVADEYFYELI